MKSNKTIYMESINKNTQIGEKYTERIIIVNRINKIRKHEFTYL